MKREETECDYYIPKMTAAIDMLVIAFLFCFSFIVTNPLGDFPLNDDWSFGLTVKHMIENGDFRPIGWTSMPLIIQVLWGSLFSIPAGFSFSALRISTLTLSLLGVFATYLLFRELRQPRRLAVITALTLAFTPIYYALSHTFMTDVPYTAIAIIAAVFFVRNLRSGSDLALFLGTILAVAATLTRQLAISVPLAFAVAFILKNGIKKLNILRAAIPPILCISALLLFQQWLAATGRLPALYSAQNNHLLRALTKSKTILAIANNAYIALLYLGLFLLPILIFVWKNIYRSNKNNIKTFLIFSASVIVIGSVARSALYGKSHLLMPSSGNILTQSGIGPVTLPDTFILNLNNMAALPTSFWLIVTVLSLLGAILLITVIGLSTISLAQKKWYAKLDGIEAARAFLLISAMIYMFPIFVGGFFDRYLIPIIPFLAAGIVSVSLPGQRTSSGACRFAAVALLVAIAFFAICGTRDYLTWNRIRWEALHNLMESKHIEAKDIDGGFEFNGWYLYDPQYKSEPQKSWWWVQGDSYRIGFGSMPGYTVIEEYNYFHWMPPYAGKIVVLKRISTGKL
jgi:4-amino-4-deoxy-L-arabinose transferase-like glycosyltransferase